MIAESQLGQTIKLALQEWDNQKALGATFEERVGNLAKTLRVALPQTREWKYLCQECRDYGLVMHDCDGDASCGRHKPHLKHDFGKPCWCSLGARFKKQERTEQTAVEAAARTPKRQPTRFGR